MKLDDITQGDYGLLHMERFVGEGTRTYSQFAAGSQASRQYRPRTGLPSFDLITVLVPKERAAISQAEPARELEQHYLRGDEVLFAVHPETWDDAGVEHVDELRALPRGEPIEAAPTSSTRTVLTTSPPEGVPPHFLKLHYPRRISRFNRRLRRVNIRSSVQATSDLAHVRLEKFAYLPDVIGVVYGRDAAAWGFLVRSHTTRPILREPAFLIPGFALYGGDLKRPDDPPLLVQLIDRLGARPEELVVDHIMIPLVECWAKVVRERGLLLESHAQNILIEIDAEFRVRRIVHRDFDVWIDAEARTQAGLETPFEGSRLGDHSPFPREQHYSLVYDRFVGHEFFDYLLCVLTRIYGAREADVRARIREAFHHAFPDSCEFFPAGTMFHFSDELLPGNDFRLVDMRRPPEWR